jgi:hypothetical protein
LKAEESVTNYFSYVKNVLGVRTVQSAKMRENLVAAEPETCDLLFLNVKSFQDTSVFSPQAKDLLDKMIQAMRLGAKSFQVREHDLQKDGALAGNALIQHVSQSVHAPFIVLFNAKPTQNGLIQNLGTLKYLETFSPAYLLQNANAKKVAWADLQKVMKELGVV